MGEKTNGEGNQGSKKNTQHRSLGSVVNFYESKED